MSRIIRVLIQIFLHQNKTERRLTIERSGKHLISLFLTSSLFLFWGSRKSPHPGWGAGRVYISLVGKQPDNVKLLFDNAHLEIVPAVRLHPLLELDQTVGPERNFSRHHLQVPVSLSCIEKAV